jgi:8-oxo-dGTP pyrophosphatase MutT (NUDIX family)
MSSAASVAADYFVRAEGPLKPSDAVAALLVREDGRYVMQLRDAKPDIFFPDHWGCFGGAVDAGERPDEALRRELREELEYEIPSAREFTRFEFDFRNVGHPKTCRIYYEVPVSHAAWSRFRLHEGADLQAFDAQDLLARRKVTPYDAFAVFMHLSRKRFEAAAR